jgi:DNA topoisomerase-1
MKTLVIVESPAKAKTIEKYLGADFTVKSSVGHIRTDTAIERTGDFPVTYEVDPGHTKVVSELKKAAKTSDHILLATDEDREGEAISWHLLEVLKLPQDTPRITFHEITKPALEAAVASPRTVNMDMVASQQARQSLDMIVGYDLSDVVRRKVPGARSAGRVQSPALRLIVEREREIEQFAAKSKYKITGTFNAAGQSLEATLNATFPDEPQATAYLNSIIDAAWQVADVATTPSTKQPPVPFTTATLQIEANQKLGFSPRTTMSAAQGLYQAGLITYHRTDSLNLSGQALSTIGRYIEQAIGAKYHQTRNFKTKSASAQEAHEAIRPSHIETEHAGKNTYEQKLYSLIRNRTLATQMTPARIEKTVVKITTPASKPVFEARGEVILFDGYLRVYGSSKETELPPLQAGQTLDRERIVARQTFDKPPARYTEGSLVKRLEELGIGRPSTYASILTALQTRGYVEKGTGQGATRDVVELSLAHKLSRRVITEKTGADKGKLLPTPVGELISDFLLQNFNAIVDYDFTAGLETELDKVALGELTRTKLLQTFYGPFQQLVTSSAQAERFNNARELGKDPKTGKPIYAKVSRNGAFIQVGDNEKETGEKPVFAPLPKGKNTKTVTFEEALQQLALPQLPRSLGKADDGAELIAASGPFGPYLKAGAYNIPIKGHDPYTITFDVAQELYTAKKASIIADWGEIKVIRGAYGPYVKGPGRFNNVKVPADTDPAKLTLAAAEALLATKKPRKAPAKRRKAAKR